jgi:hypothetical protein
VNADKSFRQAQNEFEPHLNCGGISLKLNTALSGTSPEGSACADLLRILPEAQKKQVMIITKAPPASLYWYAR